MSDAPLLPNGASKPNSSYLSRARKHFSQELSPSWADIMLILHCFVTGLLDAAVFNVWSCFVSMQTGTLNIS